MRTLTAAIPVKAAAGFAIAFLHTYIQDLSNAAGEPQLSLRVPLQHLVGGLVLERPITVEAHYVRQSDGGGTELAIAWRPEGTHLFPSFAGTIVAQPMGPHRCTLTIHGAYAAPFGAPGALFDAVVGIRIARATLDGLLQQFRTAMESDYLARIGG